MAGRRISQMINISERSVVKNAEKAKKSFLDSLLTFSPCLAQCFGDSMETRDICSREAKARGREGERMMSRGGLQG